MLEYLESNSLDKCVIWTQVSILYLVRESKGHLALRGIFLNIPISLGANYLFLERFRYFTFTSLERSFSRNLISYLEMFMCLIVYLEYKIM